MVKRPNKFSRLTAMTGVILVRAAIFLVFACTAFPPTVWSAPAPPESLRPPQPGFLQMLRTSDGSLLVGRIQSCIQDTVAFETEFGVVRIPAGLVENVRAVPETHFRQGRSWHPSPNATRLFFAPTGRMLQRGEGYFADYYLFFPSVNYGVTENLSVGGGMSIFPSGSLKNQIYFITPKIAVKKSERLNIAAGAIVLKTPEVDDPDVDDLDVPPLSIVYGVATLGSPDRSITAGGGYGMAGSEFAHRPVFVLGGEYRTGRRTSLVTENWLVPGGEVSLVSLGIRFFGEDLSVDLAFFKAVGKETSPGIPYIDFVWRF